MRPLQKNRATVLHLSVLNPATHTRIFDKEAQTLAQNGYNVHILAQGKKFETFTSNGVILHTFLKFRRLSPFRFLCLFYILIKTIQLRPSVCHIHSPELLPFAFVFKYLLKAKVIYDVHENYYKNILFGTHYPTVLKKTFANFIRAIEKYCTPALSGVIYAEPCFYNLLKHPNAIVIRNCFKGKILAPILSNDLNMLYSGTIHETFGIFSCLEFWKKLNQYLPIKLVVAGYAQDPTIIKTIETTVKQWNLVNQFELIGGKEYVPHQVISEKLSTATFCLALYQNNPNLSERIPTKFFECMAFQKPIIFTQTPYWNTLNEQYHFGIPYANNDIFIQKLLVEIKQNFPSCYIQAIPDTFFNWEPEGKKLLAYYQNIMGR